MRFFSAILVSMAFLVGCHQSNDSQNQSVSVDRTPDNYPVNYGDFSFEPLVGWNSAPTDRNKTLVMLLLGGTTWNQAEAMIKVDVGRPIEPSAEGTAKAFAVSNQGKISPETLDFDGEPGILVTTSSTSMQTPSHMVSIYRNGKLYLVMGASTGKTPVSDAMESIRSTWKWND